MMLSELERATEGREGQGGQGGAGEGVAHTGGAGASHGSSSLVGW